MEHKKNLMVKCILTTICMVLLTFLWNDTCNKHFYNGAHCYFLSNRAQDIKNVTTCVFWEELIFRLLPFLISSILITLSKHKWQKYVLYTILGVGIVCIQLQFGALHYNPIMDTSYIQPTIIHGGQGILFAVTYAAALLWTAKANSREQPSSIAKNRILIANGIGYCLSSTVHIISNVLVVLTQTF